MKRIKATKDFQESLEVGFNDFERYFGKEPERTTDDTWRLLAYWYNAWMAGYAFGKTGEVYHHWETQVGEVAPGVM